MAVRKRGGVWYYDFMINYVRYKKAAPEARTKAQAEHAETQARLEVFQGKYGRPMGDSVFIEFAEEVWLPWSRENKSSYKDDEYLIEAFREFFGKRTFANPRTGKPYKWLRRSFRSLMKLAGITDFRRHDLRHDAATNMVESGASLIEVRDILGHSDIRMTQRYAHAKEQGVHQAVARLAERAKKIVPNLSQKKKSRPGGLL